MADSDGSSGTRTVMIVIGAVLGIMVLLGLGCAGLLGFGIWSASKQVGGMIAAMTNGPAFFDHLQNGRVDEAYRMTSQAYRAKTSRTQFEEILKQHPQLTKHKSVAEGELQSQNRGTTKTAIRIEYTLSMQESEADAADPDPAVPIVKHPPPGGLPSLTVTLSFIEENGQFVIDSIVIEDSP